jgi:ABC-type nitrate/sulfonate/bicarbonate transport system permease component
VAAKRLTLSPARLRRRQPHIAERPQLSRATRIGLGFLGIVGVLVVWQLLSDNGTLDPLTYSSPSGIWEAFKKMLDEGRLAEPVLESAKLFGIGLLVSVITGLLIGAVLGWSAKVNAIFDPWVTMLYAMPGIALLPLLLIAFGSEFRTEVIVVWTIAVWPMIINVAAGVRSIDRDHLRLARSYLASGREVLWGIALPGSVPYVLAGIQQAVALSLVGVVIAEYWVGNNGLGGLILSASEQLLTAEAYVGMAIIAFAGLFFTSLVRRCERWLVKWR